MRRAIINAGSREEAELAYRRGVRGIAREKREMRHEVRRAVRRRFVRRIVAGGRARLHPATTGHRPCAETAELGAVLVLVRCFAHPGLLVLLRRRLTIGTGGRARQRAATSGSIPNPATPSHPGIAAQ